MTFQFYFKRMSSSAFLKDLSERKIQDVLDRFQGGSALVHLAFIKDKNHHTVHCRVRGIQGKGVVASASSASIFASIDAVVQKLESQLARYKLKTIQHRLSKEAVHRFLKQSTLVNSSLAAQLEPFERSPSCSTSLRSVSLLMVGPAFSCTLAMPLAAAVASAARCADRRCSSVMAANAASLTR